MLGEALLTMGYTTNREMDCCAAVDLRCLGLFSLVVEGPPGKEKDVQLGELEVVKSAAGVHWLVLELCVVDPWSRRALAGQTLLRL